MTLRVGRFFLWSLATSILIQSLQISAQSFDDLRLHDIMLEKWLLHGASSSTATQRNQPALLDTEFQPPSFSLMDQPDSIALLEQVATGADDPVPRRSGYGDQSSNARSGLSASGRLVLVMLIILSLAGALAFAILHSLSSRSDVAETEATKLWNWQGMTLRALFVVLCLMFQVHSVVIIPESYDLMMSLGYDAASSGWLIGAAWPLGIIFTPLAYMATKAPWNQELNRTITIISVVNYCVSALLYALAACPPSSWGWGPDFRFKVLMLSRLMMGIGQGLQPCTSMMAQHATAKSEMVAFQVNVTLKTLGIGLGPILSTVVCYVLGINETSVRAAAPLYVVAGFWAVLAIVMLLLIPTKLAPNPHDEVAIPISVEQWEEHSTSTVDNDQGRPEDNTSEAEQNTESTPHVQSTVWLLCLMFVLQRSFTIAGLEAAIAYILEMEFHFSDGDIGLSIGCCFLVLVPFVFSVQVLKSHLGIGQILTGLVALTILACPLLFDLPDIGKQKPALLLMAGSIIMPSLNIASSIADGLAMGTSMPGSWFSPEVFTSARNIRLITGSLAAPIARGILQSGGRNAYAAAQAMVSVIACLSILKVSSMLPDLKGFEPQKENPTSLPTTPR